MASDFLMLRLFDINENEHLLNDLTNITGTYALYLPGIIGYEDVEAYIYLGIDEMRFNFKVESMSVYLNDGVITDGFSKIYLQNTKQGFLTLTCKHNKKYRIWRNCLIKIYVEITKI